MFLGYYSYRIKELVRNLLRFFILRKNGNKIGKNCNISKDLKIYGKVTIRDNVVIGEKVILHNNVIIGSNARISNIEVGENSHIESRVIISGYGIGKIKIGKESYIGINNVLDWSDNISIGDFVHIAGPSTGLWTHSSAMQALNGLELKNKDIKFRPTSQIIIENNVYIGGNCTIYPGITIGHHAIVAPNSAVIKDVISDSLVGGVPAEIIKRLTIN